MKNIEFLNYVENYFQQKPEKIKEELFSEKTNNSDEVYQCLAEHPISDENEEFAIDIITSSNFITINFDEIIDAAEASQDFANECINFGISKENNPNEYQEFFSDYLDYKIYPFRYNDLYNLAYTLWYFYNIKK
jgi:hypothetical protein